MTVGMPPPPQEKDYEPTDDDYALAHDYGWEQVQIIEYNDDLVAHNMFWTFSYGKYDELNSTAQQFERLGHIKAATSCSQTYREIKKVCRLIYKYNTGSSTIPDNELTHDNVYNQISLWKKKIYSLTPNIWVILKPWKNKTSLKTD